MFRHISYTSHNHIWTWVVLFSMALAYLGVTISNAWAQSNQSGPDVVGLKLDKAIEILEKQGYEVLTHPHATIYPSRDKMVVAQRFSQKSGSGRFGASSKYLSSGRAEQAKLAEIWYYDLNTRQRAQLPDKVSQAEAESRANTVKLVTVPNLIGLSMDRAEQTVNQLGLGLIVAANRITPLLFQNRIIADQYPNSGTTLAPNSLVSVTVYHYREKATTQEKYDGTIN